MLDLERRLALPEFPDVAVYHDHERPRSYYVVPHAPALEIDSNGRPEARLLLYLKRQGDQKVPTGGQISLTTTLVTPAADLARIKKAIETLLGEQPPPPPPPAPAPPPVVVQLSPPEWVSGEVTIALTPSLTLTGQPALFGDNRCALMNALTAEQAQGLREHWGRKLPDASIVYNMVMRVASTASATRVVREETVSLGADGGYDRSHMVNVTAHAASGGTQQIAVKGRVWLDGLERRLTEIDLSS